MIGTDVWLPTGWHPCQPVPGRHHLDDDAIARALALGWTFSAISKAVDRPEGYVRSVAKRHGWKEHAGRREPYAVEAA